MSYSRSFTVTIVVAVATGSGAFIFPKVSGIIVRTIAVDAPGGATYDWVLSDSDGYRMTGAASASGDVTYAVNLPMGAAGTIALAGASVGTYNIRIWGEYN